MINANLFGRSLLFLFTIFTLSNQGLAQNSFGKSKYTLCQQCHGKMGEGQKNIEAPAIAGLPAWYVEAQIKKFQEGARGLHPKDNPGLRMRPMARTLKTAEEIKAVASYVESLPTQKAPQVVLGNPDAGKKQYEVCVACHGANGEGNQALNAPPLTHSSDWYLLTQLKNFKAGLRGADAALDASGASMRGMANILDENAAINVVDYIYNLPSQKK